MSEQAETPVLDAETYLAMRKQITALAMMLARVTTALHVAQMHRAFELNECKQGICPTVVEAIRVVRP